MAENVILAERTLVFTYDENYGAYVRHGLGEDDARLFLTEGEAYKVVWDSEEYSCTAFPAENSGIVTNNLGNTVAFGGADNGVPFLIASNVENGGTSIFALGTEEAHTITIYQIVEDEEPESPEGIVLKDRNGNDVAYYGIETVTFDTTTKGKQQVYTKGTKAEKTVNLDMSGGDQTIEPDSGTLLSKVTVTKPATMLPENIRNGVEIGGVSGTFIGDTEEVVIGESVGATPLSFANGDQEVTPSAAGKVMSKVTIEQPTNLIPENIAEGVNIAGIVGALAAGGCNVVAGTFTGNGDIVEVAHNLGVIPDLFVAFIQLSTGVSTVSKKSSAAFICFSDEFKAKINATVRAFAVSTEGTNLYPSASNYRGYAFESVDETVVKVGGNIFKTINSQTYQWFAISGLT